MPKRTANTAVPSKGEKDVRAFVLSITSEQGKQIAPIRIENGVPIYRFRKPIMRCGTFVKGSEGIVFSVDREILDHWVTTFSQWISAGNKVPVPLTHYTSGNPEDSAGWVVDMFREEDELIGILELVGEGAPELACKSDVSIYTPPSYVDGNGKEYIRPITHVALCTDPVITGLGKFEIIAASLSSNQKENPKMDWKKIAEALKINPEEMKDDATAETLILSSVASIRKDLDETKTSLDDIKKAKEVLELSHKPKTPDPLLVKFAAENRQNKLNALVASARITPAVRDKLIPLMADEKAISLSLGRGDDQGDFDKLIAALSENDPVKLGEVTQAQTLALQNTLKNPPASPLQADIKRRRKQAGYQD